jgi:hypothetical protein
MGKIYWGKGKTGGIPTASVPGPLKNGVYFCTGCLRAMPKSAILKKYLFPEITKKSI